MSIWPRRLELWKETRQAAISCPRVTQSNLSWNWRQTILFLTSEIPARDRLDMYPCPIRMRAQSFQNFSRKAILKLQDQLSQHDRCKNLNQRHLRCARRFKSTNQRIATVGSSKPQPCPAQGCLFGRDTLIVGFESTPITQMPLVARHRIISSIYHTYPYPCHYCNNW